MNNNSRRDFIKKGAFLAASGIVGTSMVNAATTSRTEKRKNEVTKFTLPPLPYTYDALEPHIDKLTMEIHYSKHHQAYVNNLNKALEEMVEIDDHYLEELCKNASNVSMAIRNNAGGHYNHSLFWTLMKKPVLGKENENPIPAGLLAEAIKNSFETFEDFKTKFSETAMKRFGSGWAWLVVNKDKKLEIGSTPNQDNPLMDLSEIKGVPILALDVWEHAYYLKNQNKRADYVASWWNVVNWDEALKRYTAALYQK